MPHFTLNRWQTTFPSVLCCLCYLITPSACAIELPGLQQDHHIKQWGRQASTQSLPSHVHWHTHSPLTHRLYVEVSWVYFLPDHLPPTPTLSTYAMLRCVQRQQKNGWVNTKNKADNNDSFGRWHLAPPIITCDVLFSSKAVFHWCLPKRRALSFCFISTRNSR